MIHVYNSKQYRKSGPVAPDAFRLIINSAISNRDGCLFFTYCRMFAYRINLTKVNHFRIVLFIFFTFQRNNKLSRIRWWYNEVQISFVWKRTRFLPLHVNNYRLYDTKKKQQTTLFKTMIYFYLDNKNVNKYGQKTNLK